MPISRPPPVSDVPEAEITHWQIRQLENGDRHLVGVVQNSGHDGRVSSKIMMIGERIVTTRSGRRYFLRGQPGTAPVAEYVWQMWCRYNGVDPETTVDVTKDFS
jgi:hypothetical protein